METYLVGGAVRNFLLGRPIKERDWVVVGATESQMLSCGYKKVGLAFPVFLHPVTHEEYALARIEHKTGKGYTQFACCADPNITLIEDLRRRDLTINAIAQTSAGELIDPYGGKEDLKNKILHHVSSAFAEDPVRVLRVARFAAKLGDFTVHPETLCMMHAILIAGELDALVPERVWQELKSALDEQNPERFFEVLQDCGALIKLFPEVAANLDRVLMSLKQAVATSKDPLIRFAAAIGVLSKEEAVTICKRYRVPRAYLDLAKFTAMHKEIYRQILDSDPKMILSLFDFIDAYRNHTRLEQLLTTFEITARCSEHENTPLDITTAPRIVFLKNAYKKAKNVDIKSLVDTGISGEKLREKIRELRLKAIAK